MRKTLFWLILGVCLYAFFEVACGFSLFLQQKISGSKYAPLKTSLSEKHKQLLTRIINNDTNYLTYDATLGWTIKKNGTSPLAQANSQGLRGNREYSLAVPPGVTRISSFGDSYTHGDGVSNEETWQENLQDLTPNLEVLNFGIPGFGLDQAFLRYQKEGVKYDSQIVLIGFMSENIFRHVNVFRPFYMPGTSDVFTKPRFMTRAEQLVLLNNPLSEVSHYKELLARPEDVLPQVGRHDYFYQSHYKEGVFDVLPSVRLIKMLLYPMIRKYTFANIITGSTMYMSANGYYNGESEAFQVTVNIFDAFYADVVNNNSRPIILIFPNTWDIARYRARGTETYAPLLTYFEAKHYRYLDLMKAFEQYGKAFEVKELCDGHYTPLGNKIIATYLAEYLKNLDLNPSQAATPLIR